MKLSKIVSTEDCEVNRVSYQQRAPSTCSWKGECGVRRTDTSCCTIPMETTVSVGRRKQEYAEVLDISDPKRIKVPVSVQGRSSVTLSVVPFLARRV